MTNRNRQYWDENLQTWIWSTYISCGHLLDVRPTTVVFIYRPRSLAGDWTEGAFILMEWKIATKSFRLYALSYIIARSLTVQHCPLIFPRLLIASPAVYPLLVYSPISSIYHTKCAAAIPQYNTETIQFLRTGVAQCSNRLSYSRAPRLQMGVNSAGITVWGPDMGFPLHRCCRMYILYSQLQGATNCARQRASTSIGKSTSVTRRDVAENYISHWRACQRNVNVCL